MMFYSGPLAAFIHKRVRLKLPAPSFLVLIGVMRILEDIAEPVSRTTVYVAIFFALSVEYLNYGQHRNRERQGKTLLPGQEGV